MRHVVVLLLFLLATCAPAPVPREPAPRRVAPGGVEAVLAGLSLRDRVAQLVWPWIAGSYAAYDDESYSRTVARWVDSLHVGGVLVSVGGPLDVAAKLNDLQRRAPLPLLVAADLESGASFRLTGATATPPNMGVAAGGRDADAETIARITAREGRAVGIHVTFAPVADVNNNPANPVINIRSFGEDPAVVARLVRAAVRGLESEGMASAAKHFPGHGDTDTDTHLALPTIDADWRRLDAVELVPFRAAIDAGVTGVMSAHIALPALDGGRARPATTVGAVLSGVLRDSLRFSGLVFTDALNMGGLASVGTAGEVAVAAIEAGADVLVQPADPAVVIEAVTAAVASGRLSPERIEASVRRVLALKQRFGLFQRRTVPLDSVPFVVGAPAFQRAADSIASRGVVLARDRDGLVERLRTRAERIALVTYGDERSPQVGQVLATALRSRGHQVTLTRLWPASGPSSYDSARTALAAASVAVVAVAARPLPWDASRLTLPEPLVSLVGTAADKQPTLLVSLGSPYILRQVPHVGTYLLGWLANPAMERAVAGALGDEAIVGRLPIRIPPDLPLGAGLQVPARR